MVDQFSSNNYYGHPPYRYSDHHHSDVAASSEQRYYPDASSMSRGDVRDDRSLQFKFQDAYQQRSTLSSASRHHRYSTRLEEAHQQGGDIDDEQLLESLKTYCDETIMPSSSDDLLDYTLRDGKN